MTLYDLIVPAAVRVVSQFASKKRLFQELAEIAQTAYSLDATAVFDGLQEREALGPTGVGQGIALPHARLGGLTRIAGIFLRLEKAIDYDSVDRQPIDLVFALLAPKDSGVDHLKALALVSRTMRDPPTVQKLRANMDPAKLYTILAESRVNKAA